MVAIALGGLAGCASPKVAETYSEHSVDGPRVVALVGARRSWTIEIEKRLRESGIVVKRFASTQIVSEKKADGRVETYSEATARVVLRVDGYAPDTAMTRCIAGGWKFDFITAEVIDTKTNETLASYSNSGYSENCAPMSGSIFGDITKMVLSVFK
jgi:hypothetical protein